MKKIILILSIIFTISFNISAQETQNPKNKLSFGTFALIQCRKSGGGLSLAIPVFQRNNFFIYDELTAFLYMANDTTTNGLMIGFGDKIHFGKLYEINGISFRSYGYMKTEIGASKDNAYNFFSAPVILELGGAGGFEIIFQSDKGFFVEFGGGAAITSFGNISKEAVANGAFNGGYVCITTGYRHYF